MLITVGIADMQVSTGTDDVIVTHNLGSCLGVTAWDPQARIGGMIHAMLGEASSDIKTALEKPAMFVDAGMKKLFVELFARGAKRDRLIISAAGGADARGYTSVNLLQVGLKNISSLVRVLSEHRLPLHAADIGGHDHRTVALNVATGRVTIKTSAGERVLLREYTAAAPEVW